MTPPCGSSTGASTPGEGVEGVKGLRADAKRNRARILDAAEEIFAEKGASASTEEVASRAGVAVGTVFRHFPSKQALLHAIIEALILRLTEEVETLVTEGDSATALFTFFGRMIEQAAAQKTVVDLLAETGVHLHAAKPVEALRDAIGALLAAAQDSGTVRDDVRLDEIIALLTGACQGALRSGWDRDLQRRVLTIMFDGLRPIRE